MLVCLTKALRDLLLPDMLRLFFICLLAYAAGWGALAWGFSALISHYYAAAAGGEGWIVHFITSAGGITLAWFFFPLLYPILISFFDDKIVAIIEREDYPQLAPAVPPFWPTLRGDVAFSLRAVVLNILCLPFYFVPFVGLALYYGLNGYLLGMQFFRMAAGRRVTPAEGAALQKKAFRSILAIGAAISFFSTVPLLNLAAPIIGVAAMLHLFHALRSATERAISSSISC